MYVYMHHIFLHSPVDEHLGCFHTLANVNNTSVNIGVHISFQISVFGFFGYIPRSRIAVSYDGSIFSFLGNLHVFPTVSASIYIPTNSVCVFSFLHILFSIYLWFFFDHSHADEFGVMSYYGFDLHFCDD